MHWFEDSYFLFSVKLFDASLNKSNINPKKIYCIDHSLVSSVSSDILVNSGHLLESLVFITIRRKYQNIYYYRTKSNKEVDFIIHGSKREKLLIQVCWTIESLESTKNRELNALVEAMKEINISKGLIVTKDESSKIIIDNLEIEIIPIWKFVIVFPNDS